MFIQRDENSSIKGCFRRPQEGYAEEELPDNHPDVVAFLNPQPDQRKMADAVECEQAKANNDVVAFLNMTPAELDAWVGANITGAGAQIAFKVLGRLAQNAARGKPLR